MKSLLKSIKINFVLLGLISSLVISAHAYGKRIGSISKIKGTAFALYQGKTWELEKDSDVFDFYEIIVEEGSSLTFKDYYDHKFHLSGGSHVKLMNKIIEIKQGSVWAQSKNNTDIYSVQTANSNTYFASGEGIISFDNLSGKSQVMVIGGTFKFSNVLEAHLSVKLLPGQFSFVHKDYEKGIPRAPTQVGYHSFKQLLGMFHGISPMEKMNRTQQYAKSKRKTVTPSRGIASVKAPASTGNKKKAGKIIVISRTAERAPASLNMNHYIKEQVKTHAPRPKQKRKDWRDYSKKSRVQVRVFGSKKKYRNRKPASYKPAAKYKPKRPKVKTPTRAPSSIGGKIMESKVMVEDGSFNNDLMNQYKAQQRHSDEMNNLIQDLQNYKQDYNPDY